jgi:hypothetical protein
MKPTLERVDEAVYMARFGAAIDLDELQAHFDDVREVLARGPAVVVLDLRTLGTPSAVVRRAAGEGLRRVLETHGESLLGVCHVLSSPIIRGVMTAIYWVAPLPCETLVTGKYEEGIAWAKERARRASVMRRSS